MKALESILDVTLNDQEFSQACMKLVLKELGSGAVFQNGVLSLGHRSNHIPVEVFEEHGVEVFPIIKHVMFGDWVCGGLPLSLVGGKNFPQNILSWNNKNQSIVNYKLSLENLNFESSCNYSELHFHVRDLHMKDVNVNFFTMQIDYTGNRTKIDLSGMTGKVDILRIYFDRSNIDGFKQLIYNNFLDKSDGVKTDIDDIDFGKILGLNRNFKFNTLSIGLHAPTSYSGVYSVTFLPLDYKAVENRHLRSIKTKKYTILIGTE